MRDPVPALAMLAAAWLAGAGPRAPAHANASPAAPPGGCTESDRIAHVPRLPTRTGQSLAPAIADSVLYESSGIEELYWRGDLNGDGLPDFIADYGLGSPATDFAVFAACDTGRYVRVLHVFASSITVLETAHQAWRDLRVDRDVIGTYDVELEFVQWTGRDYVRVCLVEVPVDSVATYRRGEVGCAGGDG